MDRADRTWMQRKIDVLQGEVWSMNRQNRELNKKITIKDAEIASRDDTINEILEDERQWRRKANCQKREIGKLQLELTEKWSIISRQDGELHALKGRVCDLKNGWLEETRELMQEIACARDAIDSRDGEIEKLKARIECNLNEVANERRELQRQLDFKDKQLVILNAEMMTMEEEAVTKGRQLEETVACTDDHIAKLEDRIASMEAAESVAGDLFNHEEKIFEKDRQIEELEIQIAQMRENASEKDRVLLEQVDMMTNNIEKLGSELSRQKEESTSNIVERDQRLTRGAILLIELQKSNRSFREIAYTAKRSCAELQLEFDTLHAQYVFLKSKSQEAELKVIEQFEKKADAVKREKEQVVKSFQDILKNRVRMYNKLKRAYDEFEDKRDAYEARAKIVERLECMVEALGFDKDGDDFYFWIDEDDDEPTPLELELVPGTKMSVKHRDKAIANLRNALSEKDRELRKTKGKLKRNLDSTSMRLYNEIDRLTTKLLIAESQCRDLANDYDELRIAMTNAEAEMLQYMEREGSWETEDEAESPSSSETSQMPAN